LAIADYLLLKLLMLPLLLLFGIAEAP